MNMEPGFKSMDPNSLAQTPPKELLVSTSPSGDAQGGATPTSQVNTHVHVLACLLSWSKVFYRAILLLHNPLEQTTVVGLTVRGRLGITVQGYLVSGGGGVICKRPG